MKKRGRLVHPESWRAALIDRLLQHYQEHPPFMAELEALGQRYRRLLAALGRGRPPLPELYPGP